MNWITFELPAPLVVFGGIALASILISLLPLSRFTGRPAPLQALQDKMGLAGLNGGLFFLILLFWATLFLFLFGGLLWAIHDILSALIPDAGQKWRFSVIKQASLTAVLGAVVALPFTLIRLSLSRQQVDTALEALTNDKMDNAVADLHAQRQITKWDKNNVASNGWDDDITRRNGAIDRLLGLVQENNSLRPRVDRLLTVYLRELTREFPAKIAPLDATPRQLNGWAAELIRLRSDMESAVQVLSRLPRPDWQKGYDRLPDLQDLNMQTFDLSSLTLQGADLEKAQLQGANLVGAQLQGADLGGAQLQGADLFRATFNASTQLGGTMPAWAALRWVDLSDIPQITEHLENMFGDRSVTLPEGVGNYPGHWSETELDPMDFDTQWRAWQRAGGFVPVLPT